MSDTWVGFEIRIPYNPEEISKIRDLIKSLGFHQIDWTEYRRPQDLATVIDYTCRPNEYDYYEIDWEARGIT